LKNKKITDMNLNNLNLVELNAKEVLHTEGGLEPVATFIAVVTIAGYFDWAAGEFLKGWNNPR
jgi:hypothetical protein